MQVFVQAFTGGFAKPDQPPDIVNRLLGVVERSQATGVAIGWNPAVDYRPLVERCHDRGVQVYLWLPVFSEYGAAARPALDYRGQPHAAAQSGADDDFSFACPSQTTNRQLVGQYYDRYFAASGFDGVMLDKIRFSSFGNGFRAGLGCFCPACAQAYADAGVDVTRLIARLDQPDKAWLTPQRRRDWGYAYADPMIDQFYRARADLIGRAVAAVAAPFRRRGLGVGLDVFAPPLAYLVGQDLASLAGQADFLKPMIYRVTDSPAGIPYETAKLKTELTAAGCPIGQRLEDLWATDDLAGQRPYEDQLAGLAGLDCAVLPGVEVNRLPICATSADYVTASLAAIERVGLAGAVLSWNVLAAVVYPS